MLKIIYTHASVVLMIFYYYMLQNTLSNRYSLYIYNKVEYLDKEGSHINSTKEVV